LNEAVKGLAVCVGLSGFICFTAISGNLNNYPMERIQAASILTPTPIPKLVGALTPLPTVLPTVTPTPTKLISRGSIQRPVENRINAILSGRLKGKGEVFVKFGKQYNVNSILAAAICIHETGNGTSLAIRQRNNVAGMMGKRGLMYFQSIDESIQYLCRLLKREYIDKGYTSIDLIQGKYCPLDDPRDIDGINKYWLPCVTELYQKIKNG
jgi:hypothetical protein